MLAMNYCNYAVMRSSHDAKHNIMCFCYYLLLHVLSGNTFVVRSKIAHEDMINQANTQANLYFSSQSSFLHHRSLKEETIYYLFKHNIHLPLVGPTTQLFLFHHRESSL